MGRQSQPIEFNQFIGGLITDSSPLNSVQNTSLDEDNFVLNIDGSRRRRLGIDYETSFVKNTTTISGISAQDVATTSFKWKNAGGIPDQNLSVVQIGNEIKVYNLSSQPASANLIYTYKFTTATVSQNFSYAVVDGILVVASGAKSPTIFTFTTPATITQSTTTLYIRDFFGVEDVVAGRDLFDGNDVQFRPDTLTNAHIYNLRNQTFGVPRIPNYADGISDPIYSYHSGVDSSHYPANSDNVNEALYPDANNSNNRTIDRFWPQNLRDNSLGTERAPSGYFIIDALTRGVSRLAKVQANNTQFPVLASSVTSLPVDTTPGGATVIAEFAGRIFYGGFSGDLIGGDKLSPRMSSYLLFSKNVASLNDIGRCYQSGDPTSKQSPDLVDTDGGYLRLNGAFGVKALINVGSSLVVLATNGVWRVVGGNDYGFTATNFLVEKISDHGISSSDSVVLVDSSIMFWGSDGIYHVHTDQFGSWIAENISFGKIQRLFDAVAFEDRLTARGSYDSFDRKVRWLYYNRTTDDTPTKELILDVTLKAFYTNTLGQFNGAALPRVVGYFTNEPFTVQFAIQDVTVGGVAVTVGGVGVTIDVSTRLNAITREIGYITVTQLSPVIKYTFALFNNPTFMDWVSENGTGVDAPAYMVTSYVARDVTYRINKYNERDDFQRGKTVPYLSVHLNRTETGFENDGFGDFRPINQSSCFVQTRWEWSNSANSNRWGQPIQAYRYKRLYFPANINDAYDTGFSTVVTRNRLRGGGKVLSLKFYTEAGKDCHIYGWSMMMTEADNV